jgi:hypothetical protein
MNVMRIACGAALALALTIAGEATATTLVRQDVAGLVRGSSDIVVGRVGAMTSRWDEYHQHIVTDVTFNVSESLRGERRKLTLTQLGGEVDGIRVTIAASPTFQTGEEALLFVWRDAKGRAQVNGLGQGKFDVRRDPRTSERLLSRPLPGLEIGELRSLRPLRQGEAQPRVTLDQMMSEIRRVIVDDRH